MVQASIVGTCVAVAIAAGIVLAPKTLAPKPMDQAAPAAAAALRHSMDNLSSLLDLADDETAQATGAGADPVDDAAPAGAKAYANAWLSTDDRSVSGVAAAADRCRALIDEAATVLDPGKTLVSMFGRTDPGSTPQIIALDEAEAMPATLAGCRTTVESALSAMDSALAVAKTDAANQSATTENASLRDALRGLISTAHDAMDSHTSAAAADARAAVSEQIEAAEALVDTVPPNAWQDLDQDSINLVVTTQSLDAAVTALQAIQPVQTKTAYTGGNGNLDPATLCEVPYDTKQLLRCDAEAAWMRLDAVYMSVWGTDIPIDLSYRTYDEQVEMKRIYGSGAATPGTSNHGWGTAVDLPDYREGGEGLEWNYGTPKYEWMKANAPVYGWINPSWAVQGGRGPHEPWHFEYVG